MIALVILELLFIGLGVVAFSLFILDTFTSIGYRSRKLFSTKVSSITSANFLRALAGVTDRSVCYGGAITVLRNGNAFLEALSVDILGAQKSITFSVYLWEPGKMSDQIINILCDRAKDGVQIKVLVDGQGTSLKLRPDIMKLKKAGVEVEYFRPLKFGKITRWHRRSHRRAIVIDGSVGYFGGVAIVDTWLGDADQQNRWRDYMFRVTGSLVHSVQAAFAEVWVSATGEVLAGKEFYDNQTQAESDSDLKYIAWASSPAFDTPPLDKVWWLTFSSTQRSLYIVTPFLTPYRSVLQAIIDRARAGVDVRILVPGPHLDSHNVRYAGHDNYQELLEADVRIFEFQPAMLHSKVVIADGMWSLIGSANLDIRSIRLNEENVIGIMDTSLAKKLTDDFRADLAKSKEITLEQWRRRGLLHRARGKMLRLFEEQF